MGGCGEARKVGQQTGVSLCLAREGRQEHLFRGTGEEGELANCRLNVRDTGKRHPQRSIPEKAPLILKDMR